MYFYTFYLKGIILYFGVIISVTMLIFIIKLQVINIFNLIIISLYYIIIFKYPNLYYPLLIILKHSYYVRIHISTLVN